MKSLNASSSAAGVPETNRPATDHPDAITTTDLFPGTTPAELVELIHDQPMTTSRRVAQMFGKGHDNVLQSIRALLRDLPDELNRLNFQAIDYTDTRNRRQPEFLLTKDGFMLLAMTFTGKPARYWQVAFVKAFNQMARTIQRQQKSLMNRERELARADAARTHSAVNAILADTRAERGKTTEARHYVNEANLIGYAMTGQCCPIDRSTLDAKALRLLRWVEMQDIKLLSRGVNDYPTRKAELRSLVLKAQATAQALEAGDVEPLQSIGCAA